MKAIKKIFRFISLLFLYSGFTALAGVLGILLYGITSDFVSPHMESRGLASVQPKSSKLARTAPKKISQRPLPKNPSPPQPIKTAEVINEQPPLPKTPSSNNPNLPQSITASEVKDKESLKSFVLRAKEHLEKDFDRALKDYGTNEIWKTPITHLSVIDLSGTILFAASRPHLNGRNLITWENIDGKAIFKDIITIGKNGGGFYEFRSQHPDTDTFQHKLLYTTTFKKGEKSFIAYSSFFPKNSNEQASPSKTFPNEPNASQPITASEVKDKESLKSFVLRAKKYWEEDYDRALKEFRTNKIWGIPSTFLFLLDLKGTVVFNSFNANAEGKDAIKWTTKDGKTYAKDIINIGKNGGGFHQFNIYNKNTKTHRPQLFYATSFKRGKKTFILSGFFTKIPFLP